MDWGESWSRRNLTLVGGFVSLVVASFHAAFYHGVGTSPQAVGISYTELVGQAVFGTAAVVGVLLGLSALLAWFSNLSSEIILGTPQAVDLVRKHGGKPVVLAAAFGVTGGGMFALAAYLVPEALAVSGVAAVVLVVALTRPLLKPRLRPEGADSWPSLPWQASWGFTVACVAAFTTALAITDIFGTDLSRTAIDVWILVLGIALLVSPVASAVVLVRLHRGERLREDMAARSAAVTVVALAVGLVAFAGLGAAENVRQVEAGRIPTGLMHILSGAPVRCVHVHWRAEERSPALPSPALRLGAAEDHVVFVHRVAGVMTLARDEVSTRPAGDDECAA